MDINLQTSDLIAGPEEVLNICSTKT